MIPDRLARLPRVKEVTGIGTSCLYDQIKRGLFPPAIKITGRCSAWPESELARINNARIGGASDADIKVLVRELIAARKARAAAA